MDQVIDIKLSTNEIVVIEMSSHEASSGFSWPQNPVFPPAIGRVVAKTGWVSTGQAVLDSDSQ